MAGRGQLIAVLCAGCSFEIQAAPDPDAAVDDAPVDQQAIDAAMIPGFDPASDCPGSYSMIVAATITTSRYRLILTPDVYWPQEALCLADRPGSTHLASPDSLAEVIGLEARVGAASSGARFYIGGVQSPTASVRDADWITFAGAPLIQTAWHLPEAEPDDNGDGIENQGQQLLILDPALDYLHDATGVSAYAAICECDGTAVAPAARTYVDTDPNNPN